jgi:hypothetical protein
VEGCGCRARGALRSGVVMFVGHLVLSSDIDKREKKN